MWRWFWRVDWEVEASKDPIKMDDGWTYHCKLLAKEYKLFGLTIYTRRYT